MLLTANPGQVVHWPILPSTQLIPRNLSRIAYSMSPGRKANCCGQYPSTAADFLFNRNTHAANAQDDLKYLEASEDKNEEFYGGGGAGVAGGRPLGALPAALVPQRHLQRLRPGASSFADCLC